MYFIFDIWTSRQNISYLEIYAYWVNQDWKQRAIFLGLLQLQNSHIGAELAEEIKIMMKFFDIKEI
jgi:hypothetical protein